MTKDQDRLTLINLLNPMRSTFQTVFENAFFGIVLVGTDGYFIKANKAACNLFGYTQRTSCFL